MSKRVLLWHKICLKICYPNINEKAVCEYANVIHEWNKFKNNLGKENWFRNQLNSPDEQREFFEDFFDIDLWMSLKILDPIQNVDSWATYSLDNNSLPVEICSSNEDDYIKHV